MPPPYREHINHLSLIHRLGESQFHARGENENDHIRSSADPDNHTITRANPLPNPFEIPNTPYSIDFLEDEARVPPLSRFDFSLCVQLAIQRLTASIQDNGDVPIPQTPHEMKYSFRTVAFSLMVMPVQPTRDVIYSDVIAVLRVLARKMIGEGMCARIAHMFVTADESENQFGLVYVGRFLDDLPRLGH